MNLCSLSVNLLRQSSIIVLTEALDNRKKSFSCPEPVHFEQNHRRILKSQGERDLSDDQSESCEILTHTSSSKRI